MVRLSLELSFRTHTRNTMEQGQRELVFYLGRAAHAYALPEAGRVSVGRAPENDIQVDDPSVSRHHLCLHVGASIEVEDLGSANGTYVVPSSSDAQKPDDDETRRSKHGLGARLSAQTPAPLRLRDSLRLGSVFAELQMRERVSRSIPPPGAPAAEAPVLGQNISDPAMVQTYQLALRWRSPADSRLHSPSQTSTST